MMDFLFRARGAPCKQPPHFSEIVLLGSDDNPVSHMASSQLRPCVLHMPVDLMLLTASIAASRKVT